MNLHGKTVLITGAARVGQNVARIVAERGAAKIILTYYKDSSEIRGAEVNAKNAGAAVELLQADLSRVEGVRGLVKHIRSLHGLIHMAAIYPRTPWEHLSEKEWDMNINTIARSSYLLGKYAGDLIQKNKSDANGVKGKMIFFADWSVLTRPYKEYLPYNVAKAAVVGLTYSLAKELAPDILINAIAPGPILAPPNLSAKENAEILLSTPLGRWGGAEEIALAVGYLLEADFVTGHVLPVDGGRTIG